MSKKQAIAFFEEISKNTQLAQEVEKVVRSKGSDEAKAKELISLAQRYNLNFTPDEAVSAQGSLKKPLSPEEMLEVSGGKLNLKSSIMAMALLAGLGVGGATLTNMDASAMKRTNYSSSSSDSGKRGKDENGQARKKGGTQQTTPQPQPTTTGTANPTQNGTPSSNGQGAAPSDSQQTTRRTPPSRPRTISIEERHAPKPPKEKKVWASTEHYNKAAARFDGIAGCTGQFLRAVRGQTQNGYLPNAVWPAVPWFAQSGNGTQTCRYCNAQLTEGRDPFCKNPDCIFPWTFRRASTKSLLSQRAVGVDACARWALLPALILDSRYTRITSTGVGGHGTARELPIETPAEAWAVLQLIAQRRPDGTWPDIERMMRAHNVAQDTQDKVIRLLEASYANLAHGNEHFAADLGSEIQQLVEGHNNGWTAFRERMNAFCPKEEDATKKVAKQQAFEHAVEQMEHAYNMLTAEQRLLGAQQAEAARRQREAERRQREAEIEAAREKLQRGEALSDDEKKTLAKTVAEAGLVQCRGGCNGCRPDQVRFHQLDSLGGIRFRCDDCLKRNGGYKGSTFTLKLDDLLAMLQEGAPGNAPMGEAARQQREAEKEAARRQREAERQQVIEKLQNEEKLSIDEAKAIAPILKCTTCGNIGAYAREKNGTFYFQCKKKKCQKGISKAPAALLAMLEEVAAENAPVEMADAEPNEPPMQLEIQPMQMNQGEDPTFALTFNSSTRPQIGMQGMNQFNPGQQMMQQNMSAMEMDDADDYEDNFDMGGYDDFDEDDDFGVSLNRKPKEVKERREDYENQEPYIPEPGMMGYQAPQQPKQMLSSNVFGFNLAGQDVNQFNSQQQLQMNGQNGYLGDTQQNGTQLQQTLYGQFENQVNPPQQQMAPENWQFGFDNMQTNPLQMNFNQQPVPEQVQNMAQMNIQQQTMQNMGQMNGQQQNAQVVQNQQNMTYQPDVNFEPSQGLQQPAAQQNGTLHQQNPIQQPILNLDLHHDPVGNYVNALNTDTQALAQCNNMLWGLIKRGQSGNAAQLGSVVAAAQAVVNRAHQRELTDNANQIILSVLGADPRYEKAADAFAEQLKRFNNVLEFIDKSWK